MVQRLIKNLKLVDGLLILFLLVLVFLEAFSWVQTGFPREIRESVQLAAADDFSKGINIYSLEAIRGEEFPTLNLYGCLSPLLIGGLSRLTGVSVLLMGTICYVFWKLGACFLMGYIVLRKHKDITLALLCAALLYPCFWRYEVFGGIFPDALGLFLSMLFYCVTEMGILKKRLHPFWMAFIMLLLFYTKLYFTFLLVGAALWLFIHSKTDFFHYILFGLTIGIASVGFVFWALPLFFSCSVHLMDLSTSNSILNSLIQLAALGRYFPLLIILLLIWFFSGLFRLFRTRRSEGFRGRLHEFFSFSMLQTLCIFPFAFVIAFNDGTWLTYYLQMLMPIAILLFAEVFSGYTSGGRRLSGLWKKPLPQLLLLTLLILPTCKYSVNTYMTPELAGDWERLYDRLDDLTVLKNRTLLLGPELGFYALEHKLYLLDEGVGQYLDSSVMDTWNASPVYQLLCPHSPQLYEAWQAQITRINRDIKQASYEYVVIDENWTEYFVDLEALHQEYERIERHGVKVGVFGVSVDVYRRKR